jgi:hypothetical protein
MTISFLNGFINIFKPTNASKESSFWSKEIIILNLKQTNNMNQSTSAEHAQSISKKMPNTMPKIHPDKYKLFFQKINSKMPNFKDQLTQADSLLIILNCIQIKIKQTNLIILKSKKLNIV